MVIFIHVHWLKHVKTHQPSQIASLYHLTVHYGSLGSQAKQNEGSDPVGSRRAQTTQLAPPWPGKPRPLCPRRPAVKLGRPELRRISLEVLWISSDLIENFTVKCWCSIYLDTLRQLKFIIGLMVKIVWEYVQIYVEAPQCVTVPENESFQPIAETDTTMSSSIPCGHHIVIVIGGWLLFLEPCHMSQQRSCATSDNGTRAHGDGGCYMLFHNTSSWI